MIIGIGSDLVHVPRIEKLWAHFGERFARRILTNEEYAHFVSIENKTNFLAKRFAAKEAVSKALGCGIGKQCGFHDITVFNNQQGAPQVMLSEHTARAFPAVTSMHISLSDEKDYALAFIVCT